jgi:hypothetical protein
MATKNFLQTAHHYVVVDQSGDGPGFEGGNAHDQHVPLGLYNIGLDWYYFRAFHKFALDFSDVISITKAELKIKTSSGVHVSKSSNSILISRVTSAWTPSGGSEGSSTGDPDWTSQPSVTSSGQVTRTVSNTTDTWNTLDITAIVQAWKDGSANNGIRLKVAAEAYPSNSNANVSHELRSGETDGNDPYIVLTYVSNSPPNAPTLSSPANGAVITTATPTLQFTGSDPDVGDTQQSYDLQVSTDATFASVTHWNIAAQTTGQTGFSVSRTYAGTALARGTTYYWRARTTDQDGVAGAWSAGRSFRYNALPTVPAARRALPRSASSTTSATSPRGAAAGRTPSAGSSSRTTTATAMP